MGVSILAYTSALCLTALVVGVRGQDDSAIAANLDHFWSYGRSPAVYPSPQISGSGGWEEAYQFARNMVSQMTNDEKNNITYGHVAVPHCRFSG